MNPTPQPGVSSPRPNAATLAFSDMAVKGRTARTAKASGGYYIVSKAAEDRLAAYKPYVLDVYRGMCRRSNGKTGLLDGRFASVPMIAVASRVTERTVYRALTILTSPEVMLVFRENIPGKGNRYVMLADSVLHEGWPSGQGYPWSPGQGSSDCSLVSKSCFEKEAQAMNQRKLEGRQESRNKNQTREDKTPPTPADASPLEGGVVRENFRKVVESMPKGKITIAEFDAMGGHKPDTRSPEQREAAYRGWARGKIMQRMISMELKAGLRLNPTPINQEEMARLEAELERLDREIALANQGAPQPLEGGVGWEAVGQVLRAGEKPADEVQLLIETTADAELRKLVERVAGGGGIAPGSSEEWTSADIAKLPSEADGGERANWPEPSPTDFPAEISAAKAWLANNPHRGADDNTCKRARMELIAGISEAERSEPSGEWAEQCANEWEDGCDEIRKRTSQASRPQGAERQIVDEGAGTVETWASNGVYTKTWSKPMSESDQRAILERAQAKEPVEEKNPSASAPQSHAKPRQTYLESTISASPESPAALPPRSGLNDVRKFVKHEEPCQPGWAVDTATLTELMRHWRELGLEAKCPLDPGRQGYMKGGFGGGSASAWVMVIEAVNALGSVQALKDSMTNYKRALGIGKQACLYQKFLADSLWLQFSGPQEDLNSW